MDSKSLNRNIFLYYIHSVSTVYHFVAPIFILYFLSFKLNFMEATIVASTAFYLSWVVFEIPTGMFADLYGRKKTVVAGTIFLFLGALCYSLGSTFWVFLIGAIFWGLGMALESGAIDALLYDSLIAIKKESEFKKIQGNALFYGYLATALTTLVGSVLFTINPRYPFYGAALLVLVSVLTAGLFTEPPYQKSAKKGFVFLSQSVQFAIKSPIVLASMLFSMLTLGLFFLFTRNLAPPYLQITGLQVAWFGIIFALSRVFSALGAKFAHRLEFMGEKNGLFLLMGVTGMIFVAMSFFLGWASILLIFALFTAAGASKPLIDDVLHRQTSSKQRALIFSIQQFALNTFNAIFAIVLAYLVDVVNLPMALFLCGAISLAGIIPLVFLLNQKSKKTVS